MNGDTNGETGGCTQASMTAAYLDGELDAPSCALFESHARECDTCSNSLREQRRLLCLLDSAFDEKFDASSAPPPEFTQAVKARAQTDMCGLRQGREWLLALKICAALLLVAFTLSGAAAFDAVAEPASNAFRAASGLLGTAGRAATHAGAGGALVVRAVSGRVATGAVGSVVWATLACVVVLLLWRLGRVRQRTSAGH